MLTYEEIFPSVPEGSMAAGNIPEKYQADFAYASTEHWGGTNIGSWSREHPVKKPA
jgi:hypothetical protein